MSRNLGRNECHGPVKLDEKPHPITPEEAGQYYDEFKGMVVAAAHCPHCEAKYLAWIDESTRVRNPGSKAKWGEVQDLSYLSTFNDEPGSEDGPVYDIQTVVNHRRVGILAR